MNPKRAQIVFFWAVLIFFVLILFGFIIAAMHPATDHRVIAYIGIVISALACAFVACAIDYMKQRL